MQEEHQEILVTLFPLKFVFLTNLLSAKDCSWNFATCLPLSSSLWGESVLIVQNISAGKLGATQVTFFTADFILSSSELCSILCYFTYWFLK